MKELSIEEKAKAYDEAIEKAQKWYDVNTNEGYRSIFEDIFPELKEPKDEKIRKRIIEHLEWCENNQYLSTEEMNTWIDWLEKQNQNLEKIKLEKGKWYFCIEDYHPRADCTDFYQGEKYRCEKDGVMGVWRIKNPEKYFRECETPTYAGSDAVRIQSIIQVLEYARSLSAYNQFGKDDITKDIAWLEKQGKNNMGISEATKQKLDDNLNKALEKETPESWNEFLEKQGEQPKKHDVCDNCDQQGGCVSSCPMKLVEEQKPTDKVEPKFKVGDTIAKKHNSDIHDFGSFTITDITGGKYWYNDRIICDITEQDEWEIYEPVRQKSAWSEEDERMYIELHNLIYSTPYCDSRKEFSDWLKSLKDRVQPMQEWSEEDEKNIESIEFFLRCPSSIPLDLYDTLTNWLKTIRPQSKWKPTDLQIEALESATANCAYSEYQDCLKELIGQLKKLREEDV